MDLTLRLPFENEEDEFHRARAAAVSDTPTFLHGYREGMTLREYLEVLTQRDRGLDLASTQVPATFLFAFIGLHIVGRVSIRHRLTPSLQHEGGHIGYAVVPAFRRRGVATELLRQAIPIARQKSGATKLLVTCDNDNLGSIKTIEKNGGILEDVVTSHESGKAVRRYWIDTTRIAA